MIYPVSFQIFTDITRGKTVKFLPGHLENIFLFVSKFHSSISPNIATIKRITKIDARIAKKVSVFMVTLQLI